MPTTKKADVIDELTEKLGRINAAALIEYRGLTVAEISDLRKGLRQRDVELQVTKNTLLREAAHRNNMTELDDLFHGPTAVAFIYGDEAVSTKALNDYFRTARVGEIKAGILKGGRKVSATDFAKLADLPNRQTLLAQIAGLLQSPMSQLAALFNAPAQQLAYALAALEDKGGAAGAGIITPTGAPTAEPPAASDIAPAEATAAPQAAEATAEPTAADSAPADVAPEAAAVAASSDEPPTPSLSETGGEPTAQPAIAPTIEAGGEPAAGPAATPAQEVGADVTTAPEEEGSASLTTSIPTAEVGDAAGVSASISPTPETGEPTSTGTSTSTSISGQQVAADTSAAPESEGSSAAQP